MKTSDLHNYNNLISSIINVGGVVINEVDQLQEARITIIKYHI